jgi:hypothetical protein
MEQTVTFDEIQIGKKFKTQPGITYQKIDRKQAKPILTVTNEAIANGRITNVFFNTKIPLVIVT